MHYRGRVFIDELREKRKRRKRKIAFLIVSSLIVSAVFITYALFFSGWFSIKQTHISGNKEISEEAVRNSVDEYIQGYYLLNTVRPFSNILFASSEKIEHSLREKFPAIEKINVKKNLFSKNLTIEINEREPAGIWCKDSDDKCFYFDNSGVMFKAASKFSGEVILIIEDARIRDFSLSDEFDDKELLEKIDLTKSVLDELKFIGYSNFFLPQNSFEFWIKTKEGWYVYLDKETDISTQLVALKKFLEEKISANRRQALQYIDLRVNNRIYYK